jgi:hypothetical protein
MPDQNGFTVGQLQVLEQYFGEPIADIRKKLNELPAVIRDEIERKVVAHADSCRSVRWRNLIIIVLASGAGGGGSAVGILKLIALLHGG